MSQAGKQAAAACLAAIQLAALPLALDTASPLPASALLNSPNAQIPRYICLGSEIQPCSHHAVTCQESSMHQCVAALMLAYL